MAARGASAVSDAIPVTTGLKVLKGYVYADVTIGYLPDQGRVTTVVRASMSDVEVKEVVQPLLDLLAGRAHSVVRKADVVEQIEEGIRAERKTFAKDEQARIRRNNRAALQEAERDLHNELGRASQRSDLLSKQAIERTLAAVSGLIKERE